MRDPSAYWTEFASKFRDLGLEVALIGGTAAMLYRTEERFTNDVDFIARSLGNLVETLEIEGYEIKATAEPGGEPYLLFIRGNSVRIDVQVAETRFQHSALDRARNGVVTVEDLLVFKLIAGRNRDLDDIDSILAAGHDLDVGYIDRWAAEWEVLDRWEQALLRAT